jgi:hypothetical protein
MKHSRLSDYPEDNPEITSFLGLPTTDEILLFGVLAVGVIALLAYEGTKAAGNFIGEHPEIIKYAGMAAL